MDSISQKMARFSLGLRYEDIPDKAIKEAKRFLLDSVGCALAAVGNRDMNQAFEYIKNLGGNKQSTIIGYGYKTNMPNSAFMNSLLIRAMDYNDIYWKQDPSHPSDLIPAVLSPGEYMSCSGKDVLVGIVIAYELEMRLCLAASPGIRELGWHHASLTQLVSPLVAGRMLGLNESEMVSACGISGSAHFTLGGVVAGELTNMKNTADPMAVEAGVRAAMLSSTGYSGPASVFEGKEGVFEVIKDASWDKNILTDKLGEKFLINECNYKAFPTEALTHQPITAVIEIMKENHLEPQEVKEILVETTHKGADILSDQNKYNPRNKETADHSLPYCIAVAVAKNNVLPSDFEEKTLNSPFVRELMKKIRVVANPEIDKIFPSVKRAVCTITTSNKKYRKKVDFAKGSAQNPLTDEELISKFKANAHNLSEKKINKIITATFNLEEKNIQDYINLLIVD